MTNFGHDKHIVFNTIAVSCCFAWLSSMNVISLTLLQSPSVHSGRVKSKARFASCACASAIAARSPPRIFSMSSLSVVLVMNSISNIPIPCSLRSHLVFERPCKPRAAQTGKGTTSSGYVSYRRPRKIRGRIGLPRDFSLTSGLSINTFR